MGSTLISTKNLFRNPELKLSICKVESNPPLVHENRRTFYPPDLPYFDPHKEVPSTLAHDLRKKLFCYDSTYSLIIWLDDIAAKYEISDCECLFIVTHALMRFLNCQDLLITPQETLKNRIRLIEHYMCGNVESEEIVLSQMTSFCNDTLQKPSILATLVQTLYGHGLLSEQGILGWAKENKTMICASCFDFKNWLQQLEVQSLCNDSYEATSSLNDLFISLDIPCSGDTLYTDSAFVGTSSQGSSITVLDKESEEEDEIAVDHLSEEEEEGETRSVMFSSFLYLRDTIIDSDEGVYHEETFDYLELMPSNII